MNDGTLWSIYAYFQSFDAHGCNATKREATSGEQSENNFIKSVQVFYPKNKFILEALRLANQALIPYKNIYNIPWKFCTFSQGEFPFPHTHGDTIFFPEVFVESFENVKNLKSGIQLNKLVSILIHEKIHVYQRHFPIYTHLLIMKVWNMNIITSVEQLEKEKEQEQEQEQEKEWKKIIRRNPDTNIFIYSDRDNQAIIPFFEEIEENSSKITDRRDHPYEMMAYKLCDYILGINTPNTEEKSWMNTYL